jgi:hypothetical protein
MTFKTSRRRFIAGTATLLLLPSARMARGYQANERVNLAVFGTMYNAQHFLEAIHIHNAAIVALCNPDQRRIPAVFKRWEEAAVRMEASENPDQRRAAAQYRRMAQRQGVQVFADVRRMFEEMPESIDALVVSDYDHFHGVACGEALRAGKPVCTERPLGLTISDARDLRALAAEKKLPTTYRSPGTGAGPFRRAMELVEEGMIGPVTEVHFWFKRGGPDRDALPSVKQEIPEGLNWDLWLGPLPWREYHSDWMAYSHWRETCNGGLGVFGMHTGIFPFLTLNMRALWIGAAGTTAIRVTAECARVNRISFPQWERIRWEIPARGTMPPVTMTWHQGPDLAPGARDLLREKMRRFGVSNDEEADALMQTAGSMIIGNEGALVADDHSVRVTALPKGKFERVETSRPLRMPGSRGIYVDWIDACRGGKPHVLANFDNGGPLSELLMLGNIATQFPGTTIAYDPVAGRITNLEQANALLGFEYREGWRL